MANTKDMKEKVLNGQGEMDYDYVNDILFFKLKDREYDFSMEFENMIIDVDKEKFIVGMQIFNVSEFLGIRKEYLRQIPKWQFRSKVRDNVIEVRLFYQIVVRNKIIEKNPIIIQENRFNLPSPQMVIAN